MSKITIRTATREDLPAMEWEGEFAHFRRLYADAYQRAEHGEAVLWIAEIEHKSLIGQLFVQLNSQRAELADGKTRAYIYGFRIRPIYRNHGIGTQMMNTAECDLLKRKFGFVCLNVSRENPAARRLYERLGYRVIAEDPGRWSYIDEKGMRHDVIEPAWRMEKKLV